MGRWALVRLILLGCLVVGQATGKKEEKTQKTEGMPKESKFGSADQTFQGRDHPIKTECMIPSMMDDLKEGMQHFYGHDEEAASKWFKKACYNETVGHLRDNCGCFLWAFRVHSALNKTELANLALKNAMRMAPFDSQLLSANGELLVKQERFAEAAESFKEAAKYESKNKENSEENVMMHYYNAATAYAQISRALEAIEMYKLALNTKKGEDKWSLYNSMGLLYYDLEMHDEAVDAYETALEIEPDHTAVLRNLAGVYLKQGNVTGALPLLRISAIRDPHTFESWYYLGGAYMQLERFSDAAFSFINATKINPNHTDAHKLAAENCAQAEEYERAVDHFLEAYKLLKARFLFGGCDVLSGLGTVYMDVHQYRLAHTSFLTALQRCDCAIAPEPKKCIADPFSLFDLGVVELALGDASAANMSLSASLAIQEELPEAKVRLMEAKLRLCDWVAISGERERLTALAVRGGVGNDGEEEVMHSPQWLASFGLKGGAVRTLTEMFAAQSLLRAQLAASEAHLPMEMRTDWKMAVPGEDIDGDLRIGILACAVHLRGADQHALYTLLNIPKSTRKHKILLYDWCAQQRVPIDILDAEDDDGQQEVMLEPPAFLSHLGDHVSKVMIGAKTSKQAALQINRDGVHVLISLDGWNQYNRNSILSFRPAPIQIAALGHRGTLGDTRLAQFFAGGAVSTPPEYSGQFTETLLYLPHGHALPVPGDVDEDGAAFSWGRGAAELESARASGRASLNVSLSSRHTQLSRAPVIYSAIAPAEHLSKESFDAWHTIASESRDSFVWIPKVPDVTEKLINAAMLVRAHAIPEKAESRKEAAQRIIFGGDSDTMTRILSSDVILDSHTVSNGPLLARAAALGKPCVTLAGDTLASRAASEQLLVQKCAHCMVARNAEDYVEAALRPAKEAQLPVQMDHAKMAEEWASSVLRAAAMAWEASKMHVIASSA